MLKSKGVSRTAVYESMRKLGRDAIIHKEWAAAEAYGRSYLRLVQEWNDEYHHEVQRIIPPESR